MVDLPNCKNCGAPLSYDHNTLLCHYCGTVYVNLELKPFEDMQLDMRDFYIGQIRVERIILDGERRNVKGTFKPMGVYKRIITLIEK